MLRFRVNACGSAKPVPLPPGSVNAGQLPLAGAANSSSQSRTPMVHSASNATCLTAVDAFASAGPPPSQPPPSSVKSLTHVVRGEGGSQGQGSIGATLTTSPVQPSLPAVRSIRIRPNGPGKSNGASEDASDSSKTMAVVALQGERGAVGLAASRASEDARRNEDFSDAVSELKRFLRGVDGSLNDLNQAVRLVGE
jgi:hypothetical protein